MGFRSVTRMPRHHMVKMMLAGTRLFKLPFCPRLLANRLFSAESDFPLQKVVDQEKFASKFQPFHEILALEPQKQNINVLGWVERIRKHKHVVFLSLVDRISDKTLQVILSPHQFDELDGRVNAGTALKVSGTLEPSPAPKQKVEVHCKQLQVINECTPERVPFDVNSEIVTWTTLRQVPHARPLSKKIRSVLRVRNEIVFALHRHLQENNYINIHTPIITSNDCEGGSEAFKVLTDKCTDKETFFQTNAQLTVSGQLHLEAMLGAFGKVYTLNPAFRAEHSVGRRHLAEFTMLEIEESFANLDHLMDTAESLVRFAAREALNKSSDSIEYLHSLIKEEKYQGLQKILHPKEYIRIKYDEAVSLLHEKSSVPKVDPNGDLTRFHELWLLDYFEKYPLFITHYPASLKPFYMERDGDRALNFDLLISVGGETAGGSMRENSYSALLERLTQIGQHEKLHWYADLRNMGLVPHGGFGIGVERLIQAVTGVSNIKDVIPFPRSVGHMKM